MLRARVLYFVRRHDKVAAVSLVFTVLGAVFGFVALYRTQTLWLQLLVALACAMAVFLALLILHMPRLTQVCCLWHRETTRLVGPRGAVADVVWERRFIAQRTADMFAACLEFNDGIDAKYAYECRYVDGGDQAARDEWRPIGTFKEREPDGTTVVWVMAESPLTAGQAIEIRCQLSVLNSFEDDSQFVGVQVMYPTDEVSLRVEFVDCRPVNCLGKRRVGVVLNEHTTPLAPQPLPDGGLALTHSEAALLPGMAAQVWWTWAN